MTVLPNFSSGDITRLVAMQKQRLVQAVINRLIRIGEQFIANARSLDTYKDQTGNLRSSIGYIILQDGQQIEAGGFEQVKTGATGTATGQVFIHEMAQQYPIGLVLIVVAGMSYAAAVESRGYDVLTGSGQIATQALVKAMDTLKKKAA